MIADLRGTTDQAGKVLSVTTQCVADELAAASDLVKGKASGNPVAVVRGRADLGRTPRPPRRVEHRARLGARPVLVGHRRSARPGYRDGYAAALADLSEQEQPEHELQEHEQPEHEQKDAT